MSHPLCSALVGHDSFGLDSGALVRGLPDGDFSGEIQGGHGC